MRYLIISDIHGNLEAFEKILSKLNDVNADKIYCLGDIIGYGADPCECLTLAKKHFDCFLYGNHEYALFSPEYEEFFNPFAYAALEWTRGQLRKSDFDFIKSFSFMKIFDDFTLVHGSPKDPEEFYYIFSGYEADTAFRHCTTNICFIGHTHVPQLFTEGYVKGSYLEPGKFFLNRNKRYIINCGSVGQPRDGNPQTSYGIYDTVLKNVTINRISYPVHLTQEKIIKAGLPKILADRLIVGK